jgi:hypothetical protein
MARFKVSVFLLLIGAHKRGIRKNYYIIYFIIRLSNASKLVNFELKIQSTNEDLSEILYFHFSTKK